MSSAEAIPVSLEEKVSRLKDGQDAGKALLMIEARIGELLPTAKEAMRIGGKAMKGTPAVGKGEKRMGIPAVLPIGLSTKSAFRQLFGLIGFRQDRHWTRISLREAPFAPLRALTRGSWPFLEAVRFVIPSPQRVRP